MKEVSMVMVKSDDGRMAPVRMSTIKMFLQCSLDLELNKMFKVFAPGTVPFDELPDNVKIMVAEELEDENEVVVFFEDHQFFVTEAPIYEGSNRSDDFVVCGTYSDKDMLVHD